jgi:hypothetical protein
MNWPSFKEECAVLNIYLLNPRVVVFDQEKPQLLHSHAHTHTHNTHTLTCTQTYTHHTRTLQELLVKSSDIFGCQN